MSSNQVLEMRILRIYHGQRDAYGDYMRDALARLYEDGGMEIIHHGPSLHDEDSYYVIRAHPSVAEREARMDAVYGSDEWLLKHEEKTLGMIDSLNTVVFEADDRLIEALRKNFKPAGAVLHKEPK